MATIKDVAKLAGVSPSTVSRVIADSKLISLETKLRVKQAMEKLRYVPNAIARSLACKYTSTIAITMIDNRKISNNEFFLTEVIAGLNTVADERNYNILLSMSRTDEEEQQKCLKLIHERRIDGLILTSAPIQPTLLHSLNKEKIPFVLVGEMEHPRVTSVFQDHYQATFTATTHLIEQGYRRILFFGASQNQLSCGECVRGYEEAMQNAGLVQLTRLPQQKSVEAGVTALQKIWTEGVNFDAILTLNHACIFSSLRFADLNDLSIPREMGLLGLYDSPLMQLIDPMITSIQPCGQEIGRMAMDLLLNGINQPTKMEKGGHRIGSKLKIRHSTLRQNADLFA